MSASAPILRGPLAGHALAAKFAGEVHRVHRRYAAEVVAAPRLCPHLHDVERDFGAFIVMLDPAPEPDVEATVAAIAETEGDLMHLVFPLVCPPPAAFERFGGRVHQAMRKVFAVTAPRRELVMATFHPDLAGDVDDPHRLIGLLRRAPDPFVQMIPAGYQDGGTVFMPLPRAGEPMPELAEPVEWAQRNYDKLRGAALDRLLVLQREIRAERDRAYAPYLEAFGLR
jgi:hypothetical protein